MQTRILDVPQLAEADITQMFRVMEQYYEKVSEETFRQDLLEKQKVILLLGTDGLIKGFSTILQTPLHVNGRSFIALFSGDTVLEKEYWGNGALAMAFGRYIMQVKLQHPFQRVYWFLISKGFKTYLLLANNFTHYFPRYDRPTPTYFADVMNCFYSGRYGDHYSAKEGILRFDPDKAYFIKGRIIDMQEEALKDPKVRFFNEKNPHWRRGDELTCAAEVTLFAPFLLAIRQIFRTPFRRLMKVTGKLQKN